MINFSVSSSSSKLIATCSVPNGPWNWPSCSCFELFNEVKLNLATSLFDSENYYDYSMWNIINSWPTKTPCPCLSILLVCTVNFKRIEDQDTVKQRNTKRSKYEQPSSPLSYHGDTTYSPISLLSFLHTGTDATLPAMSRWCNPQHILHIMHDSQWHTLFLLAILAY